MAASEFWQRVSASVSSSQDWEEGPSRGSVRGLRGKTKLWMILDSLTIAGAAALATLHQMHTSLQEGARRFLSGTLIEGRSMGILLLFLCGFTLSLLVISRRLRLYTPTRLPSFLHEQRLSVEACLTSGLLLTGALYLVHAEDISRSIVLITLGLVTLTLSLRRLAYRILLYRRFERGVGTRNVLIVGTGPEAQALRLHLKSIRSLGYSFKGFVELPTSSSHSTGNSQEVLGTIDTLFQHVRKLFIDEIFFTAPCERGIVQNVLELSRIHGVDLRMVPDMRDGYTWNNPVEYIGLFPTIPLHRGQTPEMQLLLKRGLDVAFSCLVLLLLAPALLLIAIAIKLDSRGPVFYAAERIGKKGRVFHCFKFRTMVHDADKRRAGLMHLNERKGVLFKINNDPRITRLGRLLRKYSLDELPQFFNVLRGEMSVVGPRPPIASEVRQYKLDHLRRLDVIPGITGLWQVQGRRDPSFDSYISLDVTYIENWSIWLDLKIILRTVGVVFAGTGT
jgi:exopolysaccharide biosynthesis polyprenyl glycosylphosphotransferase